MSHNPSVCEFYSYQKTNGSAAANRLLLGWLSDDELRARLYADMIATKSPLHFTSHAPKRDVNNQKDVRDFDWSDGPREYTQTAVLLVHPEHIWPALTQSNALPITANASTIQTSLLYSNSAYRGLGGFVMLGLDDPKQHDTQRKFALDALGQITSEHYDALATLAFKTGALVYLKSHEFDLAAMAENIALRYVGMVFGFAPKDLALLEACTRKVGRGIEYQNMARHFVFEPTTMLESRQAVVTLAHRAVEIMSLYASNAPLTRAEADEKKELDTELARIKKTKFKHHGNVLYGQPTLNNFLPIAQWMAQQNNQFTLADRGLILAGLVGGSVANLQNAICIVMAQWMKEGNAGKEALKNAALSLRGASPDGHLNEANLLHDRIKEAIRVNPPAAFIPRRANLSFPLNPAPTVCCNQSPSPIPSNHGTISKDDLILIGMGGACWYPAPINTTSSVQALLQSNLFSNHFAASNLVGRTHSIDSLNTSSCPFAKSFGGAPYADSSRPKPPARWEFTHSCPGMKMSMHLIDYTMRQLILLPSLSEVLNPKTRAPYGLEKRWGVQSETYPMRYQRNKWLVQTPLQTVLPIRTPIDKYSQELRQVIRLGAPLIEKIIRDANHVHFASFMFIENDSKLVLFTMYDGDFDAYIGHFAREFGYLFDRFFSCMAVQPRMPIREHPDEFVTYLKQFERPPVEGYYFSAYPKASTSQIVSAFAKPGELDWQTER